MNEIKSDKEAQAKDAHVGGLQLVQSPQMNKKDKNLNGALGGFHPRPVWFLAIFIQPWIFGSFVSRQKNNKNEITMSDY